MKFSILILVLFASQVLPAQQVIDRNLATGDSYFCTKIYKVTAKSGITMRSEPSLSGQRLRKVPFGKKVTICSVYPNTVETIEGKTAAWMRVDYKGKKGYIFGGFLESYKEAEIYRAKDFRPNSLDKRLYISVVESKYLSYTKPLNMNGSISTASQLNAQYVLHGIRNQGEIKRELPQTKFELPGQQASIGGKGDFLYTNGDVLVVNGKLTVRNLSIHLVNPSANSKKKVDQLVFEIPDPPRGSPHLGCNVEWFGDLDGDDLPDIILSFMNGKKTCMVLLLSTEAEQGHSHKLVAINEERVN